ncbi:MAG: hypothetical protein RSP_14730 [Rhodanobacter sp.]
MYDRPPTPPNERPFRLAPPSPFAHDKDPHGYADYREASAITGMSEGSIRNRLSRDSPYWDPTFPRPRRLGNGNGKRSAVRFIRGELYAWVAQRPEA